MFKIVEIAALAGFFFYLGKYGWSKVESVVESAIAYVKGKI